MNNDFSMTRRALLVGCAACSIAPAWARERVRVFAASSLKPALDELFEDKAVLLNYAGSGLLARQILAGAPASIFLSANPAWTDEVLPRVVPETRRDLLSNRLVLVGRQSATLAALPEGARIVTGLTDAVPLGQYARAAMEDLGVWGRLSPNLIQVESARLAVTLVARGEVDFGLVYASDAKSLGDARVLETLPTESHPPIRYPVVLLDERARPEFDVLFSARAGDIFASHGFRVI